MFLSHPQLGMVIVLLIPMLPRMHLPEFNLKLNHINNDNDDDDNEAEDHNYSDITDNDDENEDDNNDDNNDYTDSSNEYQHKYFIVD